MATKLYAVAPNICGSSVWNFMLPSDTCIILTSILDFLKLCNPDLDPLKPEVYKSTRSI